MNVSAAARSIGLVRDDGREVCGTIDEDVVLTSISSLAAAQPGNDDLFADAAMRVQLARSAGVVQPDPTSVLYRSRTGGAVQLRLSIRDGGRLHRLGHRRRPPRRRAIRRHARLTTIRQRSAPTNSVAGVSSSRLIVWTKAAASAPSITR